MIAKRGALAIATVLLLFVAVNLIASMLPSSSPNTGPVTGGVAPTQPNKNCKCEFDTNIQDFACNSDCGSKVGVSCQIDDDCKTV